MITVVYRVVAKAGAVQELEKVIGQFTAIALSSSDCLKYSFYKSLNNPNEFIVHYNFKSKESQDFHIQKLQSEVGPPRKGRDLPEKFLGLLSEEELVLFEDTAAEKASETV